MAGLFGMNVRNIKCYGCFVKADLRMLQLQSHLEESQWAFAGMTALAVSVSALVSSLALRR